MLTTAVAIEKREIYESGLEAGLEKGREEGREEGREQGREEGNIASKQSTFMMLLNHKFGEVSDVLDEMIRQVDDEDELDAWLRKALDAQKLSDIWHRPTSLEE